MYEVKIPLLIGQEILCMVTDQSKSNSVEIAKQAGARVDLNNRLVRYNVRYLVYYLKNNKRANAREDVAYFMWEMPLMVRREELQEMLGVGKHEAVRIAEQAGARVDLGNRLARYNVKKIMKYIDEQSY